MTEAAIYTGQVWHRRNRPAEHAFAYPFWLAWFDVAAGDQLLAGSRCWGARWRPVTFSADDYCVTGDGTLEQRVVAQAGRSGLDWQHGSVFALAQLRTFGWLFNPLVLYWHFPEGETQPDSVLAEVQNTPWHEHHWYGLRLESGQGTTASATCDKAFHVSPFMAMAQRYQWQFDFADAALSVRIANMDQSGELFAAGLVLKRQPLTEASRWRMIRRFGMQGLKVSAGIHAHAFRLWRKGVPFHVHPKKQVTE